jgi:hypothetical protein
MDLFAADDPEKAIEFVKLLDQANSSDLLTILTEIDTITLQRIIKEYIVLMYENFPADKQLAVRRVVREQFCDPTEFIRFVDMLPAEKLTYDLLIQGQEQSFIILPSNDDLDFLTVLLGDNQDSPNRISDDVSIRSEIIIARLSRMSDMSLLADLLLSYEISEQVIIEVCKRLHPAQVIALLTETMPEPSTQRLLACHALGAMTDPEELGTILCAPSVPERVVEWTLGTIWDEDFLRDLMVVVKDNSKIYDLVDARRNGLFETCRVEMGHILGSGQ